MGVVSGAVIEAGGHVTGVIPYAMVFAGGEKEASEGEVKAKIAAGILFDGQNRKNVCMLGRSHSLQSLISNTGNDSKFICVSVYLAAC